MTTVEEVNAFIEKFNEVLEELKKESTEESSKKKEVKSYFVY